jgi:acyl-coenzyme A thioesterase PaaI-like protein
MNVTEIPFNRHINIERSQGPESALLEIEAAPQHLNHIGTVHACVQLSLAEAASGEFLAQSLPEYKDRVFGVLRRVEAKFKNPMNGKIAARAVSTPANLNGAAQTLATKGRAIFPVVIEVLDADGAVGLQATFHWFIQMNQESN